MKSCFAALLLAVLLLAAGVIASQADVPEIVLIIGLPFVGVLGLRLTWAAARAAWEWYQDRQAW